MKTIRICTAAAAAVALMSLAQVSRASGNECSAAHKEKTFTGNVTVVDPQDKTLSVKGLFFTRNFSTAADCKVSLENKPDASLAELRPGQRVLVHYENDNGVLIAMCVAQRDLSYTGRITAIDPAARTLALRDGLMTHNLAVAPDCAVRLKGDQIGTWGNLQLGDTVQVCYEQAGSSHIARRIEEHSAMVTGTIQAVDATTRSIKVETAHGEKQVHLADSCPIVINSRLNGGMSDLHIGDRVSLSYEDREGVLVANRVSPMSAAMTAEPAAPAPAQTAKTTQPTYIGY
ncbi:MAG: hypothetical protein ACLQU4_03110 [Limisphaerales bacterium]